jgi:hypothetical protein
MSLINEDEIMSKIFVTYVARDREFVEALMAALNQTGIQTINGRLGLGDSLSTRIRNGLKQADYAILVLSKAFFDKSWPRFEFEEVDKLDREYEGITKLLPIWHDIEQQDIAYYSHELAQRLGVPSRLGIGMIVEEITEVVKVAESGAAPSQPFKTAQNASGYSSFVTEQSTPPSRNIMLTLRDNLNTFYSEVELKSLCLDLGIDYENLSGSSKRGKVLDLIQFTQRHGRFSELLDLVRQQRPHANW